MSEELQMYTKYIGDKPVKYLYGPSWKAMELLMDDNGYNTPEEAKAAWEREQDASKTYCWHCRCHQSYNVFSRKVTIPFRRKMVTYIHNDAYCAVCGANVSVRVVEEMNIGARERAYRK